MEGMGNMFDYYGWFSVSISLMNSDKSNIAKFRYLVWWNTEIS